MTASQVAIVDAGLGNIRSVYNMIKKVAEVEVLNSPPAFSRLQHINALILPGVGAYDEGVSALELGGWMPFLREWAHSNKKLVGLCLGMQLLCDSSQEGSMPGLGLIPGTFVKLDQELNNEEKIKVPHMGWNTVTFLESKATWAPQPSTAPRYYFVHSYRYSHESDKHVIGWVHHGTDFAAAISSHGAIGLQFHPEKSHRFGRDLLQKILAPPC